MRLALPRLRASIISSCSISHWFSGAGWLCSTKASHPRTDSSNRTKISPFAKSRAVCAVTETSSSLATCSASSGCARPENSIRFLRLSVQSVATIQLLSRSGIDTGQWYVPLRTSRCRVTRMPTEDVELGGRIGGGLVVAEGLARRLGCGAVGALAVDPALDVALRAGRHRERSRGYVV